MEFASQFKTILAHSMKSEWQNAERWISPLLFSVTVLLLFSFAVGELEAQIATRIYVAEMYLTALFALQISFSRIFEPDTNDRVFDLLRTYPINPSAWFLSKYLQVVIMGLLILIPTMLLAFFFNAKSGIPSINEPLIAVAVLVIGSLASVGVLLSTLVMRSNAKQILYPLIYFPLTAPVLLSAVEASKDIMTKGSSLEELFGSWLGLLVIFGVVYLTLGTLLFGELTKAE
jgi:heme exporter protein CcmB